MMKTEKSTNEDVRFVDFRDAVKENPSLSGVETDIHSIRFDGTTYINTAFKGGPVTLFQLDDNYNLLDIPNSEN